MKSNYFLQFIIFFVIILLLVPFPSNAADKVLSEAEARAFGESKGQELLSAFSEADKQIKYSKIDQLLLEDVDLDYISRFVIGKYWRKMTLEEQKRYQELFKEYALKSYKNFSLDYENEINFKISEVVREGSSMLLRTYIDYSGMDGKKERFLVEFRVHKKNNRIMLIDIKLGESSLLISYRNRFYQMISEVDEEMEWFLEDFALLSRSDNPLN